MAAAGAGGVLAVLALLWPGQPTAAGPHRPAPSGSAAAQAPPLQLPPGSQLVNGVYTSYPHTRAGAVSAAVEFLTQVGSTLIPDRAASVARLIAAPSYPSAGPAAAASALAARRELGEPASGELPPGLAVTLVPVMYQLRDVSQNQLTVLLLFDYTEVTQSRITDRFGVTSVGLTWTPQSWRMLRPDDRRLAGLLATPGTAGAVAKGWEAMTNGL
jgi:hypothetical protein